jgi:hypothetical protein
MFMAIPCRPELSNDWEPLGFITKADAPASHFPLTAQFSLQVAKTDVFGFGIPIPASQFESSGRTK